jgi:hypothetical protein
MATTYEPIATTTLGSAAASITFSTISGAYTDLVLVMNGKNDTQFDNWRLTLNSDTASNYSYTSLVGNGSTASSSRGSNATPMYIGGIPSSHFGTNIAHINNYSNTTTYKTVISRASSATNDAAAWVNLWRSTSAITTIKIDCGTGNLATGTSATLYGIKAA